MIHHIQTDRRVDQLPEFVLMFMFLRLRILRMSEVNLPAVLRVGKNVTALDLEYV